MNKSLEDDASSSPALTGKTTTSTLSRVMMFTMCMFMFTGITFETKREGEKGLPFQHHQHLGETLNTTTNDIAENTSNNTSDKFTFTLYTACSPMDKVVPALRGEGSEDINDDHVKEYDRFSRVKAKLVLKDDDENIGGNDFSFKRSIPMEQKEVSPNQLGHNDLCSQANSNVDIDDISSILNLFLKSPARDDLFTNFLVSLFTSYKIFTSVEFNLGRICVKQISSFLTIKLHKSLPSARVSRFASSSVSSIFLTRASRVVRE